MMLCIQLAPTSRKRNFGLFRINNLLANDFFSISRRQDFIELEFIPITTLYSLLAEEYVSLGDDKMSKRETEIKIKVARFLPC